MIMGFKLQLMTVASPKAGALGFGADAGGNSLGCDPTWICICVMRVCMYVRTYLYVCMHARMYVCMHACMYVCVYVCMYACIYIYIKEQTERERERQRFVGFYTCRGYPLSTLSRFWFPQAWAICCRMSGIHLVIISKGAKPVKSCLAL